MVHFYHLCVLCLLQNLFNPTRVLPDSVTIKKPGDITNTVTNDAVYIYIDENFVGLSRKEAIK